jgi:uncharacterized protein
MQFKPSKYNIITRDFNGDLIIANVLENRQAKIIGNKREEISIILKSKIITESESGKYPFLYENHFIVEEYIDEMAVADLKYNNLIYSNNALDITIIPTDDCNFNCSYCYQENRNYEYMSKETAERILLFLRKNCRYYKKIAINWFGGEPLLMKDLIIWFMEQANSICKKAGIPLTSGMSTNGYDLDPNTFSQLIKNKLVYFQITIDGTEDTHNMQRPHKNNSDSYRRIINNLTAIHNTIDNYYRINIRINITKSILELMDITLNELQEFSNNNRFRIHWQLVRDYGGERVHNIENDMLDDQNQFNDFIDQATKHNIASLHEIYFGLGAGLCAACRNHSMIIDQNGNIHKCTLAIYDAAAEDNLIGSINSNGNLLIDNSKNAIWILRDNLKESCKDCSCYPLCFNACCPFTRKYKNKDICYSEKNRLSYYLRDMSERNLIKIF